MFENLRYFKKEDEGFHKEWGGDPICWVEVDEGGDATRQIDMYPNGNIVSYDKTHHEDEHGALAVMVVNGDESWWEQYAITKDKFETTWQNHIPINRSISKKQVT